MDYSDERQQHIEDTKYLTWADGMHVMLDDLECDYELALVEDSLRRSVYLTCKAYFDIFDIGEDEDCIGVQNKDAGLWWSEDCKLKLTRAQALYIATGDVNI